MKKTKKEAPIEYGASFSMSIMLFYGCSSCMRGMISRTSPKDL